MTAAQLFDDPPEGAADLARLARQIDGAALQDTSDFDLNQDAARLAGQAQAEAAVLIPLVARPQGLAMILTKRRSNLRHHPGQIAFPGGKRDAGDADAIATALREAHEEIALRKADANILGPIGTHRTVSGFIVTPVLAQIDPAAPLLRQETEVAEIFEVPFAHLMDPANERIETRIWQGTPRKYHVIPYGPYYIWGATARITVALRQLWHAPL